VGDEGLSYAGFSYGSHLGMTYANLFPDRVRALIVDAVPDPIAVAGTPDDRHDPVTFRMGGGAAAMATLEEFFRLCDLATPSRCAFAGDAAARFAALVEELAERPVVLPAAGADVEWVLGDAALIEATFFGLYDSFAWSDLAELLSELEMHAEPAGVPKGGGALERFAAAARGEPVDQTIEAFPAVLCADSANPRNPFRWGVAAQTARDRFGYFGPLLTWFSGACARWPGSQKSRYAGPFDRVTAHPVLVMSTRFDPANGTAGAERAAELLPNAQLRMLEGWGHTTLSLSFCTTRSAPPVLHHPERVPVPARGGPAGRGQRLPTDLSALRALLGRADRGNGRDAAALGAGCPGAGSPGARRRSGSPPLRRGSAGPGTGPAGVGRQGPHLLAAALRLLRRPGVVLRLVVGDLVPGRPGCDELVVAGRALRIAVDRSHGQVHDVALGLVVAKDLRAALRAEVAVDLLG
jgi:pimeloyl-ACP methyl ester carboxylesterase